MNMVSINTPPEAVFLEIRGYIRFDVQDNGPAPAWTYWDAYHKQYVVSVIADLFGKLDAKHQQVVLRHELAHIMLGHFIHFDKCQEADALVAADVAVNWWIDDDALDYIDAAFEGECVRPKRVMEELGLSVEHYVPYPVVHDLLHDAVQQEMDSAEGGSGSFLDGLGAACAGLQGDIPEDQKGRASAISAVLAGQIKAKRELREIYGDRLAGSGAGGMYLPRIPMPVPAWVKAVEEFARSIVRSTLADKRSHTRPQQAMRAMGVHTPTDKPRWAYVPDTVCLLVDTSGSMYSLLPQVMPAIEYMRQHNLSVRLIAGDVVVTTDTEIKTGDKLPDLVGGGGTEIIPLFERAKEYLPKAIVAFTDGYVPAFPGAEYRDIDTLWICGEEVPYGRKVSPN